MSIKITNITKIISWITEHWKYIAILLKYWNVMQQNSYEYMYDRYKVLPHYTFYIQGVPFYSLGVVQFHFKTSAVASGAI